MRQTFPRFAKGRPVRRASGEMNNVEATYADLLERRRLAGEVAWYVFEGVTLKLARDTRYTPDFFVMLADDTLECHECKGFWEDDAKVKIKVAAQLFPFRFVAVRKLPKREGGGFRTEEF